MRRIGIVALALARKLLIVRCGVFEPMDSSLKGRVSRRSFRQDVTPLAVNHMGIW